MNNENFNWLAYENEAFDKGYTAICGVDEAGRGPLAGPVYAAAVVLPRGCIIDGVNAVSYTHLTLPTKLEV